MVQYVLNTFRQVWEEARDQGIVNHKSPSKKINLTKDVSRFDNSRVRYLEYDRSQRTA